MASPTNSGQFKPGNKLSKGRPKGARQKFTERFMTDVNRAWRKHGVEAIERAIEADPMGFVRAMAGLVPRDIKVTQDASDSFLEALKAVNEIRKAQAVTMLQSNKIIDIEPDED